MNYITTSIAIYNSVVYKDNKTLFRNREADLAGFLHSVYQHFDLQYPKFFKMDDLSKLGWLAAEILIKDSFRKQDYLPEEVGIVMSNASSSLDTDRKYLASVNSIPSPSLFVYTLPNIMIGEICIKNNFKGENAFFLSDFFDSDFTVRYVSYLMDNNACSISICGWVELLGANYKAYLFLVEKREGERSMVFTRENIDRIISEEAIQLKTSEK